MFKLISKNKRILKKIKWKKKQIKFKFRNLKINEFE